MGQIDPVQIAQEAVKYAGDHGNDMVFLDTAGRLHIDEALMDELKRIKAAVKPTEILLVVDAMTGQDAVTVAESFNERLGITGVAGPGGGTESKPVGLVYVALSHGQDVWLRELRPHGRYLGREWTRRLASSHALDMLRRRLAGLDVEALWTVAAL